MALSVRSIIQVKSRVMVQVMVIIKMLVGLQDSVDIPAAYQMLITQAK